MGLALKHRPEPDVPESIERRYVLSDYIRFPECKRLLNRIATEQKERQLKTITVLSYSPGEGKTLFISMLALGYFSLLRKRVLIMDTVSQTQDESFYCRGVVRNCDERNGHRQSCIDLITTKTLNQRRELAAHDLPEFDCADFEIAPFIESIHEFYDLILFDTCAFSAVDKTHFDPLVLAQKTDAAIIVASPVSLDDGALTAFTKVLTHHRIKPLGVVITPGVPHGQ